ncbi:hypothetical protein HDU91_007167, partial [Kappamyces sp. JEL0680]
FIEKRKPALALTIDGGTVSSMELSSFYRSYLEENHHVMVEYNTRLWKENFRMLKLGLQYELHVWSRFFRYNTRIFRQRMRLYIALWFGAGLLAPLILQS